MIGHKLRAQGRPVGLCCARSAARSPVNHANWLKQAATASVFLTLNLMPLSANAAASDTPRIQACPGINPNCVSTSSTAGDSYAPAWRALASSARAALVDLDIAVLANQPEALKILEAETPYGPYVAYSIKGRFSKPDIVEFLLKPDGVVDRQWDGDKAGPVVLYRSIAGEVKYFYPFTQPLTDFGTQKKRMRTIREDVGWVIVGCELQECYDE